MIRLIVLAAAMCLLTEQAWTQASAGAVVFTDNFERDLDRWRLHGSGVRVRDSQDPEHGRVMELVPNGDVLALIKGSASWGGTRMEGEMLFVDDSDNYLGFAYSFRERGRRMDFGLIYLKGNDNYLQANPHRDFNVSRTFYPEARAALTGTARVQAGVWQRFAVEVIGRRADIYIGDTPTPQMTFEDYEFDSGDIGLQPRSVGGNVWVDNVVVRRLARFSTPQPQPSAVGNGLITEWEVAGPFDRTQDEALGARSLTWRTFAPDRRGGVTTGSVVDFHGPRTVAYFRTSIAAASAGEQRLIVSTVDDLAVWLNQDFQGFLPRQGAAWFDAEQNPAHAGQAIPLLLNAGTNELVIRVRGGVYASGGFFARLSSANRR